MEEPLKPLQFHPLCHVQGHLPLDQVGKASRNPTLARSGVLRRKEALLPLPGLDSGLLGCHGIWGRLETWVGSTEQCWTEEPLYCGDRDGFGLPQKPTLPSGVSLELMGEAARGEHCLPFEGAVGSDSRGKQSWAFYLYL